MAVCYCARCTRTENDDIVAFSRMNNFVHYITHSLSGFLTTLNKLGVQDYISFIGVEMMVLYYFLGSSYGGHFYNKTSSTVLGSRKLFTISPVVSFFKNNKFIIPIPLAVIAIYTKANKYKSGINSLRFI